MRNSVMVVLERLKDMGSEFATEPYEVGWASEGIFFVRIEEPSPPDAVVRSVVQLSADGVNWVDEGSSLVSEGLGSSFVRVSHFGGWLRLKGTVKSSSGEARLSIQLALKE